MEVKEIKTLDDVVLAYHKRQNIVDRANQLYKIRSIVAIDGESTKIFVIDVYGAIIKLDYDNKFKKSFKIIISNNINKENKMEGYIERMIQEHKELVVRIDKLHAWVYGDAYKTVDAVEYANECIQLKAMKVYEEALRARLFNAGVKIAGTEYLIAIDRIEEDNYKEEESTTDND